MLQCKREREREDRGNARNRESVRGVFFSLSFLSFLFFLSKKTRRREKKNLYLTGIELSVLSMTGLARETKRASAPPKTATNARTVAMPANSESAKDGAASGSKRSFSLSSFLPARATETAAPAAFDRIELELVRSSVAPDAFRVAARGAAGLEAARTASDELAERGVAQEEARIDWELK